jgi:hypothetical protein
MNKRAGDRGIRAAVKTSLLDLLIWDENAGAIIPH